MNEVVHHAADALSHLETTAKDINVIDDEIPVFCLPKFIDEDEVCILRHEEDNGLHTQHGILEILAILDNEDPQDWTFYYNQGKNTSDIDKYLRLSIPRSNN